MTFSEGDPDAAAATEVSIDGATLAVTNRIFADEPSGTSKIWHVCWNMISDVPVESAAAYLNVLQQAGLRGACWFTIALLNLPPTRLKPASFWVGNSQLCEGDLVSDPIRFEIGDGEVTSGDVARSLRPALDYLWREFEQMSCPLFDKSGNWTGPR